MTDTITAPDFRFEFFMVTHNKSRLDLPDGQKLTPVAIHPQYAPGAFVALRIKVETRVARLASLWLKEERSGMDVLKAVSDPFIAGLMGNLWLSAVRLTSAEDCVAAEDEEVTRWILAGGGALPERWQGPADGVIPSHLPISIRSRLVLPSAYEVEATL